MHNVSGDYLPPKQLRRFIRRRLMTLGVSFEIAKAIAHRVEIQLDHRGYEGAVDYLKRVGDQLLAYLKGEGKKPRPKGEENWVRTTRAGFPKFLDGLLGATEDLLLRIAKFARSIRLRDISPAQVAKLKAGVIRPYGGANAAKVRCAKLAKLGYTAMGFVRIDEQPHYAADRDKYFLKQYRQTHSVSGELDDVVTVNQLGASLERYLMDPLLRELPIEPYFYPFTREFLARLKQVIPPSSDERVVGVIGGNQEGGAKLRMFASPYLVYQYALYPIHYWIADNFLKEMPGICTYDQDHGALWAQQQLALGHVVHSVDLSTATCRWPLEPQLDLLRFAGLDEKYVNAVEAVSRGTWKLVDDLKPSFQTDTMVWQVGQPLGIAPSMSMFAMNHCCVLAGLCEELGVPRTFQVLGDDVVIVGDELYSAYVALLDSMGVKISYNKSHSSAVVAEFAGYTITRETLVRAGQWRTVHKGNALELAEFVGRPTPYEVSNLCADIQAYRLFTLGIYDPPVEEWSSFIKVSTQLVAASLESPVLTNARLLDDVAVVRGYEAIDNLGRKLGLPFSLRALGVRVFQPYESEKSFIESIYSPLSRWSDDTVVSHFRAASRLYGVQNHVMIVSNAFTALFSLWEREVVDNSTLADVVSLVVANYYDRLDQTPRSTHYKELNTLYSKYHDLLVNKPSDIPSSVWSVRESRKRMLLAGDYKPPVTNADFIRR